MAYTPVILFMLEFPPLRSSSLAVQFIQFRPWPNILGIWRVSFQVMRSSDEIQANGARVIKKRLNFFVTNRAMRM